MIEWRFFVRMMAPGRTVKRHWCDNRARWSNWSANVAVEFLADSWCLRERAFRFPEVILRFSKASVGTLILDAMGYSSEVDIGSAPRTTYETTVPVSNELRDDSSHRILLERAKRAHSGEGAGPGASHLAQARRRVPKSESEDAWPLPGAEDVGAERLKPRPRRVLVGNAVKFTGPRGRITLGAASQGPEVLFWVKDTGAGIAAAGHDTDPGGLRSAA
jgi:hypothetical protein